MANKSQTYEVIWNGGVDRAEYESEDGAKKRGRKITQTGEPGAEVFILHFDGEQPTRGWQWGEGRWMTIHNDDLENMQDDFDIALARANEAASSSGSAEALAPEEGPTPPPKKKRAPAKRERPENEGNAALLGARTGSARGKVITALNDGPKTKEQLTMLAFGNTFKESSSKLGGVMRVVEVFAKKHSKKLVRDKDGKEITYSLQDS
jgi:hypothetical protein